MLSTRLQIVCCVLLLASVSANSQKLWKVAAIASPPFICSDLAPCNPFTPLSNNFITDPADLAPGECLHGGVRSKNGFCVHGLLVDLVQYLRLNTSAIMPYELWFTDSSVTGGYNNFVQETAQPGYLKSIGRLSACENGQDNDGKSCSIAVEGSADGITWDYPCGDSPCDLAIGDITINWFRKRVLEARFTLPYMEVGLKVITRADLASEITKWGNFLDPFTPELWWCWVAFMFFSAFAFAVIEDPTIRAAWFCMPEGDAESKKTLNSKLDKNMDGEVSIAEKASYTYTVVQKFAFLSFLSPFFAVNTDNVETKLGRTYLFGWLVVNFILTASYTASLTSFLVDNNLKVALPGLQFQDPQSWKGLPESLATCYNRNDEPCLATSLGGNTENVLKGFLRADADHFRSHTSDPSLTSSQNFDRILQGEVDGVVAWAADETTIDFAVLSQDDETQCKWVQVGESFATGAFGMVAGPSLPEEVYERVNRQLEWAKQDRSLDGLRNVWYASARQCFDERSETSALEPGDFGFLFITVPAIAVVGMVWRICRQLCVVTHKDQDCCGGVFQHHPHASRDFNDTHVAVLRLAEIVKQIHRQVGEMSPEDEELHNKLQTTEHWISDTDLLTGRTYFYNPSNKNFMWSAQRLTPEEEAKLKDNDYIPVSKRLSTNGLAYNNSMHVHRSDSITGHLVRQSEDHTRTRDVSLPQAANNGELVNASVPPTQPTWGFPNSGTVYPGFYPGVSGMPPPMYGI